MKNTLTRSRLRDELEMDVVEATTREKETKAYGKGFLSAEEADALIHGKSKFRDLIPWSMD